jgi:hypothetical protein
VVLEAKLKLSPTNDRNQFPYIFVIAIFLWKEFFKLLSFMAKRKWNHNYKHLNKNLPSVGACSSIVG